MSRKGKETATPDDTAMVVIEGGRDAPMTDTLRVMTKGATTNTLLVRDTAGKAMTTDMN